SPTDSHQCHSICVSPTYPHILPSIAFTSLFFFTAPATTEIYTLSLHDALPISQPTLQGPRRVGGEAPADPEQHLLNEILRIVVIPRQAVRDGVEETPVVTSDLLPGRHPGRWALGIRWVRHGNDAVGRLVPAYRRKVTC